MFESPKTLDVSAWPFLELEPGGDDEKLWLQEPETKIRWLFKPVVERSGHRQGEDWAEKVTAGVAGLLRVPAAQIEVAIRIEGGSARHGCISRNVRPPGWESHSGAVLLAEIVDDFEIKG